MGKRVAGRLKPLKKRLTTENQVQVRNEKRWRRNHPDPFTRKTGVIRGRAR